MEDFEFDDLTEGSLSVAYSKIKQGLTAAKRFVTSKENSNFEEYRKTGSMSGYAEDFIEDARNAESTHDINSLKSRAEDLIRMLSDQIDDAKKDLEDEKLPRIQKNQVRVIASNYLNLKRTLTLIIERLNNKLHAKQKEELND